MPSKPLIKSWIDSTDGSIPANEFLLGGGQKLEQPRQLPIFSSEESFPIFEAAIGILDIDVEFGGVMTMAEND